MAREDQPVRPQGGGTLVVYGSVCSDLSTFLGLGKRSWRSIVFWPRFATISKRGGAFTKNARYPGNVMGI